MKEFEHLEEYYALDADGNARAMQVLCAGNHAFLHSKHTRLTWHPWRVPLTRKRCETRHDVHVSIHVCC